ncbi:MAG: class I SAM-dependent methyltransferase [Holosporales bacterium]|jgi:2-polyprenyl-6-hydroxyphenyl methylase/3-demethylubiquinone-9 3-methyltransferase|nr:class I SAM-dependent methyltransferase [Holosporales bacterium]
MAQDRFSFGKNWKKYLACVDEERIKIAEQSLLETLKVPDLHGKRFLDIGSGSGLFSLAAHRLGAEVVSFDYDAESVSCTQEMEKLWGKTGGEGGSQPWTIFQGSVLDQEMLQRLGTFDVVYSWGVLHHTGDMKQAFENVVPLVKSKGRLFLSIYNDQGRMSRFWHWVKKTYNGSGPTGRLALLTLAFIRTWMFVFLVDFVRHGSPLKRWKKYREDRGMSPFRDVVDWVGGYPFEVAKPDLVFNFFQERGFQLEYLTTCAGKLRCNEFVFQKL